MLAIPRRTRLGLLAAPLLALAIAIAVPTAPAFADRYDDRYEDRRGGYNSEYLFAATRSVTDARMSPVVKVPLIPLTLALDIVVLPFEVIAGLF